MEKVTKFDWLVVGAGLSGAVFAHEMTKRGKTCLVIDKRLHVGGNCYCEQYNGVMMHKYGAHIFHTSDKQVWDYVKKHLKINRLGSYAPMAMAGGEVFALPFNMNTFSKIWPDVRFPEEAKKRIEEQAKGVKDLETLEGAAISQVGKDVFEKLIKGYTEKQWGRSCAELPSEIIGRIPVKFDYNNNYFNSDLYIGVPEGGYNDLFKGLLEGSEVVLGCDYLRNRTSLDGLAKRVFYTGPIDALFGEALGKLDYRSLEFETKIRDLEQSQGCAVMNYCDRDVPYTRIIEHNRFAPGRRHEELVVSLEYSKPYEGNAEPYYPVRTEESKGRYEKYVELSKTVYGDRVVFGGRLGHFRYFDMDEVIRDTLGIVEGLDNE